LLGTLHDRVDPVHLLGLVGHDASPYDIRVPPAQWPTGTPREHEQAATHELSRVRRLISDRENPRRKLVMPCVTRLRCRRGANCRTRAAVHTKWSRAGRREECAWVS